ncbi:MAG: GMC oxidoreductase, partial [Croceibacterium sp.]
DLARLRLVARELFALMDSEAVRAVAGPATYDEAGTTAGDLAEEARLEAWLRSSVRDYVHACGTCAMGATDDPAAVVDPRCAFIGVEGLSVADASIMPTIPQGNTNATAIMIGERASDLILGALRGKLAA